MAFDGITIACIKEELSRTLAGGRITKIAQPESDELMITIKNNREQYRLLLSASASLPLVYLTESNKQSPLTAPNFCMLLRKHVGSGKILSVTQPGLERILVFSIEHRNELGDLCTKKLIAEFMGKHSNLIFCDDRDMILDSIKHVSQQISSVREVLPGRPYFIPRTQDKADPLTVEEGDFYEKVLKKPLPLVKAVYTSLTGFSPVMAEELCFRSGLDSALAADTLDEPVKGRFYRAFRHLMDEVREGKFAPQIFYRGQEAVEYAAVPLRLFSDCTSVSYQSVSSLLETYYENKNRTARIRQKSADLRKIVNTAIERNEKKLLLQEKQMRDTEKRDKYRIFGELLNTYGYSLSPEDKFLDTVNYYTGEPVRIPLDTQLTPAENAKKYFDRYGKLKRTAEALETQISGTRSELAHLESVSAALDIAREEDDLFEIREELADCGYIRRRSQSKSRKKGRPFRPLHYVSSDGFEMFVGKNNYQNEELSFKFAGGNDWWFHAKGIPGSHVIVKTEGRELPDSTFEEAGRLAAYYSRGNQAPKVEIDYTLKKNLRKPPSAKPGFVIYHTNYSMMVSPDIRDIKEIC